MNAVEDFIQHFTIPKVAKKLNVTERCVYKWLNGDTLPGPEHMVKLVELSKNRLTFAELIHHHLAVKGKSKNA